MMKKQLLFLLATGAVLLTACGGGGGGDAVPPVTVDPDAIVDMPASAAETVEGLNATLAAMPADDRANPLGLDRMSLPTSDTSEPLALE
jgi:hypothetical protein